MNTKTFRCRSLPLVLGAGMILVAVSTTQTQGAITTFASPSAWVASLNGASEQTEDFESFDEDTPLFTAPDYLSFSFFNASATELVVFGNQVDIPPDEFYGDMAANGTAYLHAFTDADANQQVVITPTSEVSAFAFTHTGWNSTVAPENSVLSIASSLSTYVITDTSEFQTAGTFFGFTLSGGEEIVSLTFRSTNADGTFAGDGFGMDNVRGAFVVPEPSPALLALLGLGLGAFPMRRRRQQPVDRAG